MGEGRNASSRFTTFAIPTFLPVALEISTLCFYLAESLCSTHKNSLSRISPREVLIMTYEGLIMTYCIEKSMVLPMSSKKVSSPSLTAWLIEKNCEAANKAFAYLLKYENPKMGDINAINVVIVSKEKHLILQFCVTPAGNTLNCARPWGTRWSFYRDARSWVSQYSSSFYTITGQF